MTAYIDDRRLPFTEAEVAGAYARVLPAEAARAAAAALARAPAEAAAAGAAWVAEREVFAVLAVASPGLAARVGGLMEARFAAMARTFAAAARGHHGLAFDAPLPPAVLGEVDAELAYQRAWWEWERAEARRRADDPAAPPAPRPTAPHPQPAWRAPKPAPRCELCGERDAAGGFVVPPPPPQARAGEPAPAAYRLQADLCEPCGRSLADAAVSRAAFEQLSAQATAGRNRDRVT